MSFVKTITTNIKSPDGQSRTFELGKYTLLVGPMKVVSQLSLKRYSLR